ncbi:hypothetical protein H1R20_g103, partial [Candolleomyces eurysporus]
MLGASQIAHVHRHLLTNLTGAVLLPIHNVPDDILNEIFLQCLPEHDLLIDILPSKAPVLLTHVCRHWRRVALEFAGLWTSIKLTLRKPKTLERSNLQIIAEELKRFKKAPARLQVAVARGLSVQVNVLDPLLVPFTGSLTSLVLSRIPISQIHSLPSGLFPSLERLVLYIDRDDYKQSARLLEQPIVAFESAPALRRVTTSSLSFGEPGVATLRLPWHQLTHLIEADYSEGTDRFFIELLPQCVALQWLHIVLLDENLGRSSREPWRNEPVRTVQKLQSLTLNFWGSYMGTSQYPVFFDNFKFPGLRSLRMEGSSMDFDDEDAWDPNQVDRFIHKIEHEFHLEYLSICLSPIPHPSLERLFKATPHVTMLDAHIYDNYENFFEILTIGGDPSQDFLPQLKTLILELSLSAASEDGEGETIDPDTFAAFLESRMRCAPGSRLRKIVLYGEDSDEISDEIPFVQVIQRYFPEGLLLERHVVAEIRDGKVNDHWVERDPELQDWLEAGAACRY